MPTGRIYWRERGDVLSYFLLRNWIIYRNQTPEQWGTAKAEGLLTGGTQGTRGVKEGRGSRGNNFFVVVVLKSRVAERGEDALV